MQPSTSSIYPSARPLAPLPRPGSLDCHCLKLSGPHRSKQHEYCTCTRFNTRSSFPPNKSELKASPLGATSDRSGASEKREEMSLYKSYSGHWTCQHIEMTPVRFWALFQDLEETNRLCGVSPRVNVDIAERPPSEFNKPHRLKAPEK
jgi:hypothetical protein